MTQELLPCPNPWCDALERDGDFSPVAHRRPLGNWSVSCTSCVMSGPICSTEAAAITAWNTRTIPDPQAFMEAARGMRDLCLELIQRSGFTYKARNGRDCYIEDESGERCVLVPHEVWAQIEASLAAFDATLGEQ